MRRRGLRGAPVGCQLSRVGSLTQAGIAARFDLLSPHSVDYVRRESGRLITQWGESSQAALRALMEQAFVDGIPPRRLASLIIDSGIGLTTRDALAVERFRTRLEDSPDNDYTQDRVDTLAERYADRLLRARAEAIARTETITAENQGQLELWRQAEADGLIDRAEALIEWSATPDERLCPICSDLDGETIQLGGVFSNGVQAPAAHPQCRCGLVLWPTGK